MKKLSSIYFIDAAHFIFSICWGHVAPFQTFVRLTSWKKCTRFSLVILKQKKNPCCLFFFSPSLVSLASARIIISDGGPDFCRGFKRLDGFCSHIKKANPVSSFTASWHESSRLCSPTPCFVLKRTPGEDEWDQLISCWQGRAATPGIPAEPVKTQRFADGADMSADLRQPVSHGSRVCTTCR